MLESIVIHNFAIIDQAHIDFSAGMTALTGETGAGKSILLDAIQLVLGDRADVNSIKATADRADICVSFDISNNPSAQEYLQQQSLDNTDGECLLRRVIQQNGRSKAFINGQPVPLTQMRDLGEMLVDIHGQHEHQSLQKALVQRQLLDASIDPELLDKTRQAYHHWQQLKNQLETAQDQSSAKQQRVDLLELYCAELDELDLKQGEMAGLNSEYQRQSHAGQLMETSSAVIDMLYDNDQANAQSILAASLQQMEALCQIDNSLKTTTELVHSAWIQVSEASNELRSYLDRIDVEPGRLDWINQRLNQVQHLSRKHQIDAEKLTDLHRQFHQELDQLRLNEEDIEALQSAINQAYEDYLNHARKLSTERHHVASRLSADITEVMQSLGMQGGIFEIQVMPIDSTARYHQHGIDQVVFTVSANPGQPLRPIQKVASGGELSRISLAIQVILSASSQIPTLIFDEVDSGIGGGIAEIVGRKLRQIAANRQVFCVTHLPQVASQAHQHYRVNKYSGDQHTTTEIHYLDQDQRLEEIARMLGGMTITEQTRAHAREMIDNS